MVFTLSTKLLSLPDRQEPDQPSFAPGRLIVGLDINVVGAADKLIADVSGATIERTFDSLEDTIVLGLPSELSVEQALAQVGSLPYVRFAEPDHIVEIASSGRLAVEASEVLRLEPQVDGSNLEEPPPEIARCIAVGGWWLDFEIENLTDEAGNITGYLEISTGPGFSTVVEYDADMNFLTAKYSDSSGFRSATYREVLTDGSGTVTGYREVSNGHGAEYSYASTTVFDAAFNVTEADHSDNQGYVSSTRRSETRDDSGTLIGYVMESSGSGPDHSYVSTEVFDASFTVLASDFRNSHGYSSSYRLDIGRDETGRIIGYTTTYIWSGGDETYTAVNNFDADWNHVGGDFENPFSTVDSGPQELPIISLETKDITRAALAGTESRAAETLDGRALTGAKLKGTSGDDIFLVDDLRDKISGTGRGDDMVVSADVALDLRRKAFGGIEHAALTGRQDLALHGDRGNNKLLGNSGDNFLDGGKGMDTLFGGLGEDVFVIRASQRTPDQIMDFSAGEDSVQLAGKNFRSLFLPDGRLKTGVIGDRLVFDADKGELSYDRDGSAGRIEAKVIAILVGVTGIDADDFIAG